MTTSEANLEFGIFPVPAVDGLEAAEHAIVRADHLGLDLVGIQDHPYQRRFVDTLTWIAHLAARTERIRFFPDVINLPLRPPAVLAKTAASIDLLSGGRFELGLGAGAFWEAIEAMGGPTRTTGEAREALSEAIDVIRLMWSDERSVRYDGDHYGLAGVRPGPRPAHDIGIWLGVGGPKALALLGEKADGWIPSVPSMPIETLNEKHDMIDAAALKAGRDPSKIRRLANVNGVITDGASEGFLRGPQDQWVDELAVLVTEHRIESFVLWSDGDMIEQTERFAEVAADLKSTLGR